MNLDFENKINQNNIPEIGKIIDESFVTFKKTVWITGFGIILLILFVMPISLFAIFQYLEISSIEEFVDKSQKLESDFNYLLMNAAIGTFLAIFIAPLTAAFYNINHLAKQNLDFGISNLFCFYKKPYFIPLASSALLATLYSNLVGLLLIYIHLPLVGSIMQAIIALLFIFSIPLIIFEKQSALTAMSNSSKIAVKHPFTIILCMFFAVIIALLGIFAICIGIIFTVGYFYTISYTLYNEIIPIDKTNTTETFSQN